MTEPVSIADTGDVESGGESENDYTASEHTAIDQPTNTQANTEATTAAEGAYWRENIRLLISLMAIWFTVSFGFGILFRGFLDQFSLGGYPLGFWFAQQGSIYVFIALIIFYVVRMKQIERKYDLDD